MVDLEVRELLVGALMNRMVGCHWSFLSSLPNPVVFLGIPLGFATQTRTRIIRSFRKLKIVEIMFKSN